MAKYIYSYIEWWSEPDPNATVTAQDEEGYYECEYTMSFEADTLAEAKKKALLILDSTYNSSGVFSVYRDGKVVFTEEDIKN